MNLSTLVRIDRLCRLHAEQDNPYAPMIGQTKVVVPDDKSRKIIMRNMMTALMYHFSEGCLTDVTWSRDRGVMTLCFDGTHVIELRLRA